MAIDSRSPRSLAHHGARDGIDSRSTQYRHGSTRSFHGGSTRSEGREPSERNEPRRGERADAGTIRSISRLKGQVGAPHAMWTSRRVRNSTVYTIHVHVYLPTVNQVHVRSVVTVRVKYDCEPVFVMVCVYAYRGTTNSILLYWALAHR